MQFGPLLPVAGLDPATHVSVNQFAEEMKDVDGRANPAKVMRARIKRASGRFGFSHV
jgi:hypothetical protein